MSTATQGRARLKMSKIFKELGYRPHEHQAAIHTDRTRNRVVAAGRRFGKSNIGGAELDVEAVKTRFLLGELEESGKRREFWIVGPEYTDAEKEFRAHYNALKAAGAPMDKPGTYYDPHSGDMQLSMYGGKYLVIGKSAKHPERLVGEGLSGVIMAEAAKQRERTWTKFIRPMLADFGGWSLHSSTPEGKNWFYELWMRGQSPLESSWQSWRAPSWMNPYVYPMGGSDESVRLMRARMQRGLPINDAYLRKIGLDLEIAEMLKDMSEETFNQEIAALFTEFAGRVFKQFDDEVHVKDFNFRSDLATYAAVDYGFTNPFVWLLIQEDVHRNTVYVVDEIYETGLDINEAGRLVVERGLCPPSLRTFYPDPASPGDTRLLERHLKKRASGGTGGELNARLTYIREGLRFRNPHLPEDHPERLPKLIINRRCTNTIREFNDYRYPETSKEAKRDPADKPMKKDDHTPEALGRFYVGRYGPPATQGQGARVARSNMSG